MNDKEIVAHSRMLRKEADQLLYRDGLLLMLKTRCPTQVIGSYTLDTMTWPDLDISIELPHEQDIELFCDIGKRIATKFQVTKMSYSNHFIRNFPGFDHGLYWGIRLNYAEREWKIDLWGYSEADYRKHITEFNTLHRQLQQADRLAILRIKHAICQRPDYRGDIYNSMAVYRAVLTEKVTSIAEFNTWLERN